MPAYIINAMEPKLKLYAFGGLFAVISLIYVIFLDKFIIFDTYFSSLVLSYSTPFLDKIFMSVTAIGSVFFWLLIVVLLWIQKNKKLSFLLFFGLVIDIILVAFLKFGVSRQRPEGIVNTVGSSFPSGHSSRSFLAATILTHYTSLIYILAFLVAFSRIYLGVHYFSDVLFGSLIGVGIGIMIKTVPDKTVSIILKKLHV